MKYTTQQIEEILEVIDTTLEYLKEEEDMGESGTIERFMLEVEELGRLLCNSLSLDFEYYNEKLGVYITLGYIQFRWIKDVEELTNELNKLETKIDEIEERIKMYNKLKKK